jgi:hypothetical protein
MNHFASSTLNRGCRALGLMGALAASLAFSSGAQAALGEDADSVAADQIRLQASLQVVRRENHTMHELQVPSGGNIRQFVAESGKVFAVSWSGGWRPNLRELLGKHYDRYLAAAKEKRTGRGPLRIEIPGLVVVMGGHQRAFFGHAYLTDLLPQGFRPEDIR